MGIFAWIAVGLTAGLLANILLPGKRPRGLIFIRLTCLTGALGGAWPPASSARTAWPASSASPHGLLSSPIKRAMARQAEAELEKRAKIINAEGESLAAATASGTAMS
jgi:uncharacterized membrane protein YeaQ/YmgE (transglycosylase-associated protein family)